MRVQGARPLGTVAEEIEETIRLLRRVPGALWLDAGAGSAGRWRGSRAPVRSSMRRRASRVGAHGVRFGLHAEAREGQISSTGRHHVRRHPRPGTGTRASARMRPKNSSRASCASCPPSKPTPVGAQQADELDRSTCRPARGSSRPRLLERRTSIASVWDGGSRATALVAASGFPVSRAEQALGGAGRARIERDEHSGNRIVEEERRGHRDAERLPLAVGRRRTRSWPRAESGRARKRPPVSGFTPEHDPAPVAEADQAVLVDVDAVTVRADDRRGAELATFAPVLRRWRR